MLSSAVHEWSCRRAAMTAENAAAQHMMFMAHLKLRLKNANLFKLIAI
jgi:hypothetical protein